MVATSSPSIDSQACIAWPVSASGSPEAKPSTTTTTARCQAAKRCGLATAAVSVKGIAAF
jgi:hypothetical protein